VIRRPDADSGNDGCSIRRCPVPRCPGCAEHLGIVLGVGPIALAVDAPSRHVFVANRGENTVSMLALMP
jgi:hypothetical protein